MRYASPLFVGAGAYLWTIGFPVWGAVLVILAIIITTTRYITEINLDEKEYRDYLSLLWIPLNDERTRFKKVEKIVITKDNHSQMLNSRSRSRQIDWSSFTGTLITDGNRALTLITRTDKKELINALREFVDLLNVELEDQTTSKHFTIDVKQ